MVEFIKNSTNYGLFILESDGVNNDDWETDHSHIKEADWDLYTEGTEGIFLPFAGSIKHTPAFNIDVMDFFMGAGVDVSLGEGHDLFMVNGRFGGASETIRNTKMENLLLLYFKHLKLDTEVLYLGYRKRGEIWEPFIDITPAVVYFLKGKLINASYERAEDELYYNWKVVFRGVQ
ncbi:hypothetical protein LCGC14_1557860 [marine sediment metagenome]|uniref:Uncharacterized protein n=1 Tax=marine sediment metagenome TaxID=412755 RepID=A0A0F9LP99_9ZZZZ